MVVPPSPLHCRQDLWRLERLEVVLMHFRAKGVWQMIVEEQGLTSKLKEAWDISQCIEFHRLKISIQV